MEITPLIIITLNNNPLTIVRVLANFKEIKIIIKTKLNKKRLKMTQKKMKLSINGRTIDYKNWKNSPEIQVVEVQVKTNLEDSKTRLRVLITSMIMLLCLLNKYRVTMKLIRKAPLKS